MDKKQVIKLLYKSLDAKLDPEEEIVKSQALLNSAEIRKEFGDIGLLRDNIKSSAVTSFSPAFKQKVINKLDIEIASADRNALFYDLFPQFRKIAFSALMIILVMFLFNLKQEKTFTMENAFGVPEITLENIINPVFFSVG